MGAVPVVTSVRVAGPVTSEAYKDKSAVIIRPEGAERVVGTPFIADGTTAVWPGDPVEDPARWVVVAMVMVEASVRM